MCPPPHLTAQVYGSDFVIHDDPGHSSADIRALSDLIVHVVSGQSQVSLWGERDALQISRGLSGITI
jgi:hypothetical protein